MSVTIRRAGFFLLAALAAVASAAPEAAAQPLEPRLVLFEGFYNPG